MIRDIENGEAAPRSLIEEWNLEPLQNLRIKRHEHRKTTRAIAQPNEIKTIIDDRERKARTDLERGRDRYGHGGLQLAIGEKAMGRVKWQGPVLVCPNNQRRKVAEEIVGCIQITARFRPDVGKIPVVKTRTIISQQRLRF